MSSLLVPEEKSVENTTRGPIRQIVYEMFVEANREDDYYKTISDPKKLKLLADKYGDEDSIRDLKEIGQYSDVGEHLPNELFGLPVSKKTMGQVVGWQRGITGATRGILQLAGSDEMKEELAAEDAPMQALRESEYGSTGAEIIGAVMEPIGWAVPMGKTQAAGKAFEAATAAGKVGKEAVKPAKRELYKAIATATGASGLYGASYYVEEGESRLDNALLFGGIGMVASGIGAGLSLKGIKKEANIKQAAVEGFHTQNKYILSNVSDEQRTTLLNNLTNPEVAKSKEMKTLGLIDAERYLDDFINARTVEINSGNRVASLEVEDVVDNIYQLHKETLERRKKQLFGLVPPTTTKGGKRKKSGLPTQPVRFVNEKAVEEEVVGYDQLISGKKYEPSSSTAAPARTAEEIAQSKARADEYLLSGMDKYVEPVEESVTSSTTLIPPTIAKGQGAAKPASAPNKATKEQVESIQKTVGGYLYGGLPKHTSPVEEASKVADEVVEEVFPELTLSSGETIASATKKGVYATEKSAKAALRSKFTDKLGVSPDTHTVVEVEGGFGIIPKQPSLIQKTPTNKQSGFVDPVMVSRMALAGVGGGIGYGMEDDGTLVGLAAGSIAGFLSPTIGRKLWSKAANRNTYKVDRANRVLDDFEKRWAQNVSHGLAPEKVLEKTVRDSSSNIMDQLAISRELTGRPLRLARTQQEASILLDAYSEVRNKSLSRDLLAGIDNTLITHVPKVYGRIMQHYQQSREQTTKYLNQFDMFANYIRDNTTKAEYDELTNVWLDGDAATRKWLKDKLGEEGLTMYVNTVRPVIDEIGTLLVDAKVLSKLKPDYLPRFVSDYEGMTKHFPIKHGAGDIAKLEMQFTKKMGRPPTDAEKAYLITEMLEDNKINLEGVVSSARERTFENVPKQLRQYYADPIRAMHTFVQRNIDQVSKSKLFGEKSFNFVEDGKGGVLKQKVLVSLDNAIADLIATHHPNLGDYGKREVKSALVALFGKGETPPAVVLQGLRDIATGVVLGNPLSASVQLGDMVTPSYVTGIKSNIKGVMQAFGYNKQISAADWGFVNHWSEEFVSTLGTKQFANNMLKYGGFRYADILGKDTFINAAFDRISTLAKGGDSGVAKLREKYSAYFPEEAMEQMITDLQHGKISQDVKTSIFIDLAKVQPITPAQFSKGYLENPNLRFMYYLKSFMLRWINRVRYDAVQEMQRGNVKEGLKNLTYITSVLGASSLIGGEAKRTLTYAPAMIKGEVDPSTVYDVEGRNLPIEVGVNAVKTLGLSEYLLDNIASGRLNAALSSLISTPVGIADKLFAYTSALVNNGDLSDEDVDKIMNSGWLKVYRTYFGGGAERMLENEIKRSEKISDKWENRWEDFTEGFAEGGLVSSQKENDDEALWQYRASLANELDYESEDAEQVAANYEAYEAIAKQREESLSSMQPTWRDMLDDVGYNLSFSKESTENNSSYEEPSYVNSILGRKQ